MKNIKKVIVLVAALGAIATAFFMVFMRNMPNVFDWDLEDE
jgi:hypothetical protein